MARKPVPSGVDMIVALGPKKPMRGDNEGPVDDAQANDDDHQDDLDPFYEASYKEYQKNPSAQTMHDMIKAVLSEDDGDKTPADSKDATMGMDMLKSGGRHD